MKTYYKTFKLKSGEIMACQTEEDYSMLNMRGRFAITVTNPVIFNSFKFLDGDGDLVETISMMPMIPVTDEVNLDISVDHIFSITEMRPQAVERFTRFLDHLREQIEAEDKVQSLEDTEDQEQEELKSLDLANFSTKIVH
jgi:hypothetical protein